MSPKTSRRSTAKTAKATKTKATSKAALVAPISAAKSTRSAKKKDNNNNNKSPGIFLHANLKVWKGNRFIVGFIREVNKRRKKPYHIEYRDGKTEWIDLKHGRYELLSSSLQPPSLTEKNRNNDNENTNDNNDDTSSHSLEGSSDDDKNEDELIGVCKERCIDELGNHVRIGAEIEVYVKELKKYFTGIVTRTRDNAKQRYYVEYFNSIDCPFEWIDLDSVQWRLINYDNNKNINKGHLLIAPSTYCHVNDDRKVGIARKTIINNNDNNINNIKSSSKRRTKKNNSNRRSRRTSVDNNNDDGSDNILPNRTVTFNNEEKINDYDETNDIEERNVEEGISVNEANVDETETSNIKETIAEEEETNPDDKKIQEGKDISYSGRDGSNDMDTESDPGKLKKNKTPDEKEVEENIGSNDILQSTEAVSNKNLEESTILNKRNSETIKSISSETVEPSCEKEIDSVAVADRLVDTINKHSVKSSPPKSTLIDSNKSSQDEVVNESGTNKSELDSTTVQVPELSSKDTITEKASLSNKSLNKTDHLQPTKEKNVKTCDKASNEKGSLSTNNETSQNLKSLQSTKATIVFTAEKFDDGDTKITSQQPSPLAESSTNKSTLDSAVVQVPKLSTKDIVTEKASLPNESISKSDDPKPTNGEENVQICDNEGGEKGLSSTNNDIGKEQKSLQSMEATIISTIEKVDEGDTKILSQQSSSSQSANVSLEKPDQRVEQIDQNTQITDEVQNKSIEENKTTNDQESSKKDESVKAKNDDRTEQDVASIPDNVAANKNVSDGESDHKISQIEQEKNGATKESVSAANKALRSDEKPSVSILDRVFKVALDGLRKMKESNQNTEKDNSNDTSKASSDGKADSVQENQSRQDQNQHNEKPSSNGISKASSSNEKNKNIEKTSKEISKVSTDKKAGSVQQNQSEQTMAAPVIAESGDGNQNENESAAGEIKEKGLKSLTEKDASIEKKNDGIEEESCKDDIAPASSDTHNGQMSGDVRDTDSSKTNQELVRYGKYEKRQLSDHKRANSSLKKRVKFDTPKENDHSETRTDIENAKSSSQEPVKENNLGKNVQSDTPSKEDKYPSTNDDTTEVMVGSRVEVWWSGDKRFYAGRVIDQNSKDGMFLVEYDDGDKDYLDLSNDTFRVISQEKELPLGTVLEVMWDDGNFYEGTITKKHKTKNWYFIEYSDGESIAWIDLTDSDYRILDMSKAKPAKAKPPKSSANKKSGSKKGKTGTEIISSEQPRNIDSNENTDKNKDDIELGTLVEVRWDDGTFHMGEITKKHPTENWYFVEYDNGESIAWIDMNASEYIICDDDNDSNTKKDAPPGKSTEDTRKSLKSTRERKNSGEKTKKIESLTDSQKNTKGNIRKEENSTNSRKNIVGNKKKRENPTDSRKNITGKKKKRENPNDSIPVGTRVRVWWKIERKYFAGVITEKRKQKDGKNFFIEFDDGDKGWIDLQRERYSVIVKDDGSDEYSITKEDAASSDEEEWDEKLDSSDSSDEDEFKGNITRKKNAGLHDDDDWDEDSTTDYSAKKKVVTDKHNLGRKPERGIKMNDDDWDEDSTTDYSPKKKIARKTARDIKTNDDDWDEDSTTDYSPKKKIATNKNNLRRKPARDKKMTKNPADSVSVGTRLKVWWNFEKQYFSGVVVKKANRPDGKNFYIEYDDGDKGWFNLELDKFSIIVDEWDELLDDDQSSVGTEEEEGKLGVECLEECPDLSLVHPRTRIAVWWPCEATYFSGTVKNKKRNFFSIDYDDGDHDDIDLRKRRFRLLLDASSQKTDKSRYIHEGTSIDEIDIGSRILIFWSSYSRAFEARVLKKHPTKESKFLLQYTSGLQSWTDFGQHKTSPVKKRYKFPENSEEKN